MVSIHPGGIVFLPEDASIRRVQTQNYSFGCFGVSASQKYPIAPKDRRGMADSRQFDLPVIVLLGPFDWYSGGIADAGAARTPKSGPLLGAESRTRYKKNQQSND